MTDTNESKHDGAASALSVGLGNVASVLEARKVKGVITFEQWLAFLDTAALTAGFRGRIAADTGAECWQDYYDDGYTPNGALTEDLGRSA